MLSHSIYKTILNSFSTLNLTTYENILTKKEGSQGQGLFLYWPSPNLNT